MAANDLHLAVNTGDPHVDQVQVTISPDFPQFPSLDAALVTTRWHTACGAIPAAHLRKETHGQATNETSSALNVRNYQH